MGGGEEKRREGEGYEMIVTLKRITLTYSYYTHEIPKQFPTSKDKMRT